MGYYAMSGKAGLQKRMALKLAGAFCLVALLLLLGAFGAIAAGEKTALPGKLTGQLRSYYMQRDYQRSGVQEAMAVGGWLSWRSPAVKGLSLGFTGYTSQPFLVDDPDRDGTSLLATGQNGYSVLGEAFVKGSWEGLTLRAGRLIVDTPMINPNDYRMTPITHEAGVVEYRFKGGLALTAAHVVGIKGWNDTTFASMSAFAGLGGDEPVSLAGAIWTPHKKLTVQAWEYLCYDFMNMLYAQVDYVTELLKGVSLTVSGQAFHQRDIGDARGGTFNTGQGGLMAMLAWEGWEITLGFTSADKNHDIVNPWGCYPGYTSIMEEDNDRAGEETLLFGLKYDFSRLGLKGLSAYTSNTASRTPDYGAHASPNQTEHDLTVDYIVPGGGLKGLWLRVRYAYVDQDNALGGEDYSDFRVILNLPLNLLP